MTTMITDPSLEESLKAQRQVTGADRYDEVWEGTYVIDPLPNDEHQEIVSRMTSILEEVIGWPGLGEVRPGVNVSDREDNWKQNYRVPDVAVFLPDGTARNCDTYWLGGPDFVVEIISPNDQTRQKLPFYEEVGVRELLLVDRNPWSLELFRHDGKTLAGTGECTLKQEATLTSRVVPLEFKLVAADPRPLIEVRQLDGQKHWLV